MPTIIKWKVAKIDEPWKLDVVKDNEQCAISTINGLGVILFGGPAGAGATDFEAQANNLRGLTGDQIADALVDYWRTTQIELKQTT